MTLFATPPDYSSRFYHYQFFLTSEPPDRTPHGWVEGRMNQWFVYTCPNLPLINLRSSTCKEIGLLLGLGIDSGRLFRHGDNICLPTGAESDHSVYERWISSIRGRYVVLVDSGKGVSRFDLDPLGTLAANYAEDGPVIASTWSLLKQPSDSELAGALSGYPCDAPCQAYPAGLTRSDDVSRLLPNHFLDILSWRPRRYWPNKETIERASHITDPVASSTEEIGNILDALVVDHNLYLPLTAGQDSRMILACAGESVLQHSEGVTFLVGRRRRDRADAQLSRLIASSIGIKRVTLKRKTIAARDRIDYLRRIGVSGGAGKGETFWLAAADGLDLSRIFVTGFGGGALRGYYQFASPEESRDAAILLGKCELPVIDRFQHAMENWRAALDGYPSGIVADLLYHEIRGGCWAMPHQYGIANFVGTITPFSSRNLLISCIVLPRNSRRALMKRAINDRRPELGSLPFNDFVGIRRFMRRVVHNRFWKLDRST